jgi:hypothetical protein
MVPAAPIFESQRDQAPVGVSETPDEIGISEDAGNLARVFFPCHAPLVLMGASVIPSHKVLEEFGF